MITWDRSSLTEGYHPSAADETQPPEQSLKARWEMEPEAIPAPAVKTIFEKYLDHINVLEPDSERTRRMMHQLEALAYTEYMLGSVRTGLLLSLIQLNFTRALIRNAEILRLTSDKLHDEALSPFNIAGPWQVDFEASLPPSLRPTPLQRTVPHHPWLDLLPVPRMRDNLLLAGDSFDDTRLCHDLGGYQSVRTGRTGLIV